MTIHLDCPSAPLGEVEPVRLHLVLGEDVGLDLVLGDPLGLVLGDLLEEGFLGGVVVSRGRGQTGLKLGYCCTANLTWRPVLVNIHTALLMHRLANSTFSSERVTIRMNKA